MAGKKKDTDSLDSDMNLDDLEDFGELDLGDMEDMDLDDRNPSSAGVAKELAKEAGTGFLESLVTKTASKALPPEYTSEYSTAVEYGSLGKEMFTDGKNRIEKSMFKLGSEVKKILPFQSKILDNFLDRYREENEQHRQASEEAMREASIGADVSAIFDKQLEVQAGLEARREARDQIKDRQELATTKMNQDILTSIDRGVNQQSAFTLQIGKEYYRRSLELQYKSYYVQADLLKTTRDYFKGFSVQFDSMVKNTGLPDYVKLTNSERAGQLIRDKVSEGIYSRMFNKDGYINQVKERAKKYVSNKVEDALSPVDAVTDQLEMINSVGDGGSAGRLIAGVLASLGGSTLGDKLSDKISPEIRERIKNNKLINAGASGLQTLSESPTTFFAKLRNMVKGKQEELEGSGTIGSGIGSKILGGIDEFLGVTDPGAIKHKITKHSILDHDKPAIFSNKTDKAITEVIPMYLAAILKQNTDLTKMYSEVNTGKFSSPGAEELVFDYEGRNLVTKDVFRRNVEEKVLAKKGVKEQVQGVSTGLIRSAAGQLNKDKAANKDQLKVLNNKNASKILTEYMNAANKSGVTMDFDTLIKNGLDETKVPPTVTAYIDKTPGLKAIIEALQKGVTNDTAERSNRVLDDIKTKYPTSGVIEFMSKISQMASKTKNIPNREVAETIAEAVFVFQAKEGRDVLPEDFISGRVFTVGRVPTSKVTTDFKTHVGIMNSDIKKILDANDIEEVTALLLITGILNTSIRNSVETPPGVFQKFYDYSPVLGTPGDIDQGQLIERRLSSISSENLDTVTFEDIRSINRQTKEKVREDRAGVFSKLISSKLVTDAAAYKADLKEAGSNPLAILKVTMTHAKKASETIREASVAKFKEAGDSLDSIKSTLSGLVDENAKKSVSVVKNKVAKTITSIDALIVTENSAQEEKIKALNELKNNVDGASSDPKLLSTVDRDIKITQAYYKDKIKVLTEIKSSFTSLEQRLRSIETSMETKSASEVIKEVYDAVGSNLDRFKDLLDQARKVDQRGEEVPA